MIMVVKSYFNFTYDEITNNFNIILKKFYFK